MCACGPGQSGGIGCVGGGAGYGMMGGVEEGLQLVYEAGAPVVSQGMVWVGGDGATEMGDCGVSGRLDKV